jgi:hypothetical protein
MVAFGLGTLECETKQDIIYELQEIIKSIDNGNDSGMTNNGTWWNIDGVEEFDYE